MNARQARKLMREIEQSGCIVTGRRVWASECWELTVEDHVSGGQFVVRSPEDWVERVRASKIWEGAT